MKTVHRPNPYSLITSGQSAVRVAEQHGSPESVAGLDKALCALPLTDMDCQADHIVQVAVKAVELAMDAEEWQLLDDVEHTVSCLIHEPDGATMKHPAVLAVAMLATRAAVVHGQTSRGCSSERSAWERAYLLGLEALSGVVGVVYGEKSGRGLDKRMSEFVAAVRRAIPYAALFETRRALVEAARAYGLFVIGMRQPMPSGGRWEWARRIGDALYLFEVVPPLVENHPYGSVAVCRTTEDGTAGPVRYIPLGPNEDRRRAVVEAQYRI